MITAEAIAEAFNTASPRSYWGARVVNTGTSQYVYFKNVLGMIDLNYSLTDGVFTVVFTKAVANFNDYCNAIAKGLVTVLTALEAGGAPFKAPSALEGVEIVITHRGVGNGVTARLALPQLPPEPEPFNRPGETETLDNAAATWPELAGASEPLTPHTLDDLI